MSSLDRAEVASTESVSAGDVADLATVISNERRVEVLQILETDPSISSLSTLADRLTVREYGPQYRGDERKNIYVGLYQTHLERLDEADAIDLNDRGKEFDLGDRFDDYVALIDAVDQLEAGDRDA